MKQAPPSRASAPTKRRVLFTGHAPVHFLCFRPLFERLRQIPGVEVYVSGGFRHESDQGYEYDPLSLYRQLSVPVEHILQVEDIFERDFDVLFAANTNMLEPRSAVLKVQIFHGVSFRNRAVRAANLGADRFFMVGPYMKRKFVEAGLLEADDPKALEIGFMKTDALLDESLDRQLLRDQYGLDGSRPIVAFCPTGQKNNALDVYGLDLIERIKDSGRYDLLIKLHDHPHDSTDWSGMISGIQDRHTRLVESYDVMPVLFTADLLITDASSVSSEYSLLDRPILFMDTPDLIERARQKAGSMADTMTWGHALGAIVKSVDDLLPAADSALARPDEHASIRRQAACDLFFNPGTATQTALDWFLNQQSGTSPSPPPRHLIPHVHP